MMLHISSIDFIICENVESFIIWIHSKDDKEHRHISECEQNGLSTLMQLGVWKCVQIVLQGDREHVYLACGS